jgi:hypothetical protein
MEGTAERRRPRARSAREEGGTDAHATIPNLGRQLQPTFASSAQPAYTHLHPNHLNLPTNQRVQPFTTFATGPNPGWRSPGLGLTGYQPIPLIPRQPQPSPPSPHSPPTSSITIDEYPEGHTHPTHSCGTRLVHCLSSSHTYSDYPFLPRRPEISPVPNRTTTTSISSITSTQTPFITPQGHPQGVRVWLGRGWPEWNDQGQRAPAHQAAAEAG